MVVGAVPVVVGLSLWTPDVVQRRGGFISRVQRFDNGCGLFRIDGFDDITVAADYVLGAFAVLRGGDGLIVDVRGNGGGALSVSHGDRRVCARHRDRAAVHREVPRPTRPAMVDVRCPGRGAPAAQSRSPCRSAPVLSPAGKRRPTACIPRGRVRLFGQRTPRAQPTT